MIFEICADIKIGLSSALCVEIINGAIKCNIRSKAFMDLETIVSNLFSKLFFGVYEIFLQICDSLENILSHIDDEQIHLSIV